MKVRSESEVVQSCVTLHDPMDHSLPRASIHGILQARVLEWGATAFSVRVNEESEKAGLYLHIQKTKIIVSGAISPWQIEGKKVETVTDIVFSGSRITVDGDCSHIKRCLLVGRKAMTNQNSILKSRDITLLTNVYIVKATVFPVVMYICENWTIKKAECQRIDAFKLQCWGRLLESLDQQGDQTSQS